MNTFGQNRNVMTWSWSWRRNQNRHFLPIPMIQNKKQAKKCRAKDQEDCQNKPKQFYQRSMRENGAGIPPSSLVWSLAKTPSRRGKWRRHPAILERREARVFGTSSAAYSAIRQKMCKRCSLNPHTEQGVLHGTHQKPNFTCGTAFRGVESSPSCMGNIKNSTLDVALHSEELT